MSKHKVIIKKSPHPAWRCLYSTPAGSRWLTVHAETQSGAEMLAKQKLMTFLYKCGWGFVKVVKHEEKIDA